MGLVITKSSQGTIYPVHIISIKITNKNTRSASSQIEKPGNIQIVNPLHYSKIELSEQLLHESIHSLLYLFEFQFHPITLRNKNGGNSFEFSNFLSSHSPWSGNFIGDVSLAHAIFVYFGLSNFYIQLKDKGSNLWQKEIDRGIINTCFGFLSISDIRKAFTSPEIVYDWSMDAFKLMQSLIKKRVCNEKLTYLQFD